MDIEDYLVRWRVSLFPRAHGLVVGQDDIISAPAHTSAEVVAGTVTVVDIRGDWYRHASARWIRCEEEHLVLHVAIARHGYDAPGNLRRRTPGVLQRNFEGAPCGSSGAHHDRLRAVEIE